jgi:two-component system sensor histidine kinase PhoQ
VSPLRLFVDGAKNAAGALPRVGPVARLWRRWRPRSIRTRLLLAASLVLTAFFVITAAALVSAFGDSARQAQQDKLEGIVYSLLAAASAGNR